MCVCVCHIVVVVVHCYSNCIINMDFHRCPWRTFFSFYSHPLTYTSFPSPLLLFLFQLFLSMENFIFRCVSNTQKKLNNVFVCVFILSNGKWKWGGMCVCVLKRRTFGYITDNNGFPFASPNACSPFFFK